MNRRTFLRSVAVLAAGVTGAGCSNNTEVPATAPEVPVTETEPKFTSVTNPQEGIVTPTRPDPGNDDDGITIPGNISTRRPGGPTPSDPGTPTATPTATPTPTPTAPLDHDGFDLVEGADGNLVLEMTVTNPADSERAATVAATVSDDGESYDRTESATIPGGESRTFQLSFPFDYESSRTSASVSVSLSEGTPTPGTTTDGA